MRLPQGRRAVLRLRRLPLPRWMPSRSLHAPPSPIRPIRDPQGLGFRDQPDHALQAARRPKRHGRRRQGQDPRRACVLHPLHRLPPHRRRRGHQHGQWLTMRAGQVSVEYLTTSGWVIIVVLSPLSALYQYDVFAPSRLTKPTCDLGTQLVCQDAYLDTGGQFRMLIVNTFIEKVNINRLTFLREEAVVCTLPAIEPSTQCEVLCTLDLDTSPNEGRTVAFTLFFRRNETGAQVYNVSGMIHTRVQTPRLIAPPLCEQLSGHECGSTETCRGTELDDRTPGV